MEYRRSNRKTGGTTITNTPYSKTSGKAIKPKTILTEQMKRENPLMYLYCNVGDEI